VQLLGNAVVVREASKDADGRLVPRVEFRGEFLHALQNLEQLRSNKPILLIHGDDRFTSDQFEYDNLAQVAQLAGRVHATVAPRK